MLIYAEIIGMHDDEVACIIVYIPTKFEKNSSNLWNIANFLTCVRVLLTDSKITKSVNVYL